MTSMLKLLERYQWALQIIGYKCRVHNDHAPTCIARASYLAMDPNHFVCKYKPLYVYNYAIYFFNLFYFAKLLCWHYANYLLFFPLGYKHILRMNHTGQKNIRHQIVFHLKLLDLLEIPQKSTFQIPWSFDMVPYEV